MNSTCQAILDLSLVDISTKKLQKPLDIVVFILIVPPYILYAVFLILLHNLGQHLFLQYFYGSG